MQYKFHCSFSTSHKNRARETSLFTGAISDQVQIHW